MFLHKQCRVAQLYHFTPVRGAKMRKMGDAESPCVCEGMCVCVDCSSPSGKQPLTTS